MRESTPSSPVQVNWGRSTGAGQLGGQKSLDPAKCQHHRFAPRHRMNCRAPPGETVATVASVSLSPSLTHMSMQVAEELGDKVTIYKLNTDDNQDLATQLQIHALPTLVFIGMDASKPALRTEGLLPAASIKDIILNELCAAPSAQPAQPAQPQP